MFRRNRGPRFGPRGGPRRRTFRRFRTKKVRRYARGSFRTRVLNAMLGSTGWRLLTYKATFKVTGNAQNTVYWGTDVGLGGSSITWSQGGDAVGGGGSGDGDFMQLTKAIVGTATSGSQYRARVKFSTIHLTLRNQGNFGCYLKVYWLKTPIANAITSADTCNELLNTVIGALNSTVDTQHSDLTDYPTLPKYATIVSRRKYEFMPGETKQFTLSTFMRKFNNIDFVNFRTRGPFTRSIVFQFTGFPLHDANDETKVGSAPISVDIQTNWRCKGYLMSQQANTRTATSLGVTMPNPVGQQWQSGAAHTAWAS